MPFAITSSVFSEGGKIPSTYACDGEDISPPLAIRGAPGGTRSYAVVCDDPDAPVGTWVHWVMWNWPADTAEIPERLPKSDTLPNGARQGLCWGVEQFSRVGYFGPCPPSGTHRYVFKAYALDAPLILPERSTVSDLRAAMNGHVLAEAKLTGLYVRAR